LLGFPANDFAGQEPGTNEEIAEFCRTTFGVRFPMFGKIAVTGEKAHPLYRALTAAIPRAKGDPDAFRRSLRRQGAPATEELDVVWNFEKFLVSRAGEVVGRFAPDVVPDDPRLRTAVERELEARRRSASRSAGASPPPRPPSSRPSPTPPGTWRSTAPGCCSCQGTPARSPPSVTRSSSTWNREPLGDIPVGRYSSQNTVTRIEPDRLVEWALLTR
jgi:glutathione peroxidase-family protein